MIISVVIMTYNADKYIAQQLEILLKQTHVPDEILIVDSHSTDSTIELVQLYCLNHGIIKLFQIKQNEFDHGGSRDIALRQTIGSVVLFFTQDALPFDEFYIERIIEPFDDCSIAAVCGRQIAYEDSRMYEKLIREFNYPKVSRTWDKNDKDSLGIKTYFFSDVCSAYRKDAYLEIGGFDAPILTSEDMMIAAKFINADYRLAYCAEAKVYHSHNFTLRQEYKRNFLIGQVMKQFDNRIGDVGYHNEGICLFKYVTIGLIKKRRFHELIYFVFNSMMRISGNKAGKLTAKTKNIR